MVDPLRQAIARIDAGDLKGGQALLLELVGREAEQEEAWMWLAASTERMNVRRYYLYRAIQINPHNDLAQQILGDDDLSRSWLAEQLRSRSSWQICSSQIQASESLESNSEEAAIKRSSHSQIDDAEESGQDNQSKSIPRILFLILFILASGAVLELGIHFAFRSVSRVSAAGLPAATAGPIGLTTPLTSEALLPAWAITMPALTTETATSLPTATPIPTPQPTPTLGPDTWKTLPIIPAVSNTARAIYQKGLALGNNPNAFSKVGDCNSLSTRFLTYFDGDPESYFNLRDYAYLQPVIEQFGGSFKRQSIAVGDGYNTSAVLSTFRADPNVCTGGESPLTCEYKLQKPSFAIIAIGTDDYLTPADFERNMRQIIETTINLGIVPILATKADDADQLDYNPIIARLAGEYDIPLWNLWLAFQPLPGQGLEDNMHPSGSFAAFDFTSDNLNRYGWTQRNLTALQSLYEVWSSVSQP
jgi:hypothetical protein